MNSRPPDYESGEHNRAAPLRVPDRLSSPERGEHQRTYRPVRVRLPYGNGPPARTDRARRVIAVARRDGVPRHRPGTAQRFQADGADSFRRACPLVTGPAPVSRRPTGRRHLQSAILRSSRQPVHLTPACGDRSPARPCNGKTRAFRGSRPRRSRLPPRTGTPSRRPGRPGG